MDLRFQTISASVRPFRVAVVIDSTDPEWQQSCLAVVEYFSKLWGGAEGIIVPSDGSSLDELFWLLLMSHDPDIVLYYRKSGEDIRRNSPSRFEEIVDSHVREAAKRGTVSEYYKAELANALRTASDSKFAISESLGNEILLRIAPFHFEKRPVEPMSAGSSPHFPLTALVDVIDEISHSERVFDLENDTGIPNPWLAMAFGYASQNYLAELAQKGISLNRMATSQLQESKLINMGLRRWNDADEASLMELSQSSLASVRSVYARNYDFPNLAVVGDSVSDFCLAYSLRRLHDRVAWAPQWFFEDKKNAFSRFMKLTTSLEDLGQRYQNDSVTFISASLSNKEIQDLLAPISEIYTHHQFRVESAPLSLIRRVTEYPLRQYERGNIDQSSIHQLVNDEIPGAFDSPKLKTFRKINAQKIRWLVELNFLKHRTPRHPSLGPYMIGGPMLDSNNARAAKDGPTYICPSAFISGFDPDFNLVRPVIRIPQALDIFREILRYGGFETEISDKGRYASVMVQKLGGLENAGVALRSSSYVSLFEKFTDVTPSAKGVNDQGVYLKDERRYLNFLALEKIFGNADQAVKVIDEYVAKGILFRGFIFGCEFCSNVAWFSVAEIGQTFTCRRCTMAQQYSKKNWKAPDEPAWFYKLDEIVYQAVANNSIVPILAVDALRRRTRQSFLHCPELRINKTGEQKSVMEVDICCISDGALTIGEAKRNGVLGSSSKLALEAASRYLDLGRRIGAVNFVFATTQTAWDALSENAIRTVFTPYPSLSFSLLTKSEIYGTK